MDICVFIIGTILPVWSYVKASDSVLTSGLFSAHIVLVKLLTKDSKLFGNQLQAGMRQAALLHHVPFPDNVTSPHLGIRAYHASGLNPLLPDLNKDERHEFILPMISPKTPESSLVGQEGVMCPHKHQLLQQGYCVALIGSGLC